MKYLITGGCGFLGSNLSHHILQKNNDELFIIDNLSRKGSNKNLNWLKKIGDFKFFKVNVSNKKIIETKCSHKELNFKLAELIDQGVQFHSIEPESKAISTLYFELTKGRIEGDKL